MRDWSRGPDAQFLPAIAVEERSAPADVRFGFEELALPEAASFKAPENRWARALMERLGMTREPADGPKGAVFFGIDANRWRNGVTGEEPVLLGLLARSRVYGPFRVAGAALTGVAAGAWFAERAFGWANAVAPFVESVASHALWLLAGLIVLAGAASVARSDMSWSRPRPSFRRDGEPDPAL